jgi:hypothetical protein
MSPEPQRRWWPSLAVDALAVVTFILIVVRAFRVADVNWDTLQYHWSYAARAAGICDPQCLAFDSGIDVRYHGFPMVYHWAYGMLWRIFGTPLAGHALTIGAVVALCVELRRRFEVPLAWSWLAFLAIPLVQIHLSASYADVVANAAITLALIVLVDLLVTRRLATFADLAIAAVALATAAGTKLQIIPVAGLAWLAIAIVAIVARRRRDGRFPWAFAAGLAVAGIIAVLPQALANLWRFHNPFYPIAFNIAGHVFPGEETVAIIQQASSLGTQWKDTPSAVRWLASVLEFDAFRGRSMLWTIDQGDVLQSSPSFRMGGYFVAYVIGLVALIVSRSRARELRPLVGVLAAVTLLCALLPNSHELRYYMFWMLMLVASVLIAAFAPAFADRTQPALRRDSGALVLIALASVVLMTGAAYLKTSGMHIRDLVAPTDAVVDALAPGSTLCVANRDRHAILYSRAFHPNSDIHVRMLQDADAPGCTKVITLP